MENNGHGGNAPLIFIVKAGEDYKCECCQETKPSNEYDECILRDTKKRSYCVSGVKDLDSASEISQSIFVHATIGRWDICIFEQRTYPIGSVAK